MSNCPECGKPMVKTESQKRKGFAVLKHANAEDQKNCGVKFIPVRSGDGAKKEAGATEKNYKKAVEKSKRGKSSATSSDSSSSSGGSGKDDAGGSSGGSVQKDSGSGKLSGEYPYYR